MYTIIMNNDKSLTSSNRTTIYQHEKLTNQIQFLFPQIHDGNNLSDYIAILRYTDQGNITHNEIMAKDSELYKERLRYIVPIDSKLSYFAGNISIRVIFAKVNEDTGKYDAIFMTGNHIITIEPTDVTDSIEAFEKISVLEKEIEHLKEKQVDDLKLTDDLLQLSVNGKTVGEGVTLPSGGEGGSSDSVYDEDGAPVIDMDNLSLEDDDNTTESEDDVNNKEVVEF